MSKTDFSCPFMTSTPLGKTDDKRKHEQQYWKKNTDERQHPISPMIRSSHEYLLWKGEFSEDHGFLDSYHTGVDSL